MTVLFLLVETGVKTLMYKQSSLSPCGGPGVSNASIVKLRTSAGSWSNQLEECKLGMCLVQLNCWMQEGEYAVVMRGLVHDWGFWGGAKRPLPTGGCANGMPRNLFTLTSEDGRDVEIPTITPESMVAVGAEIAELRRVPRTSRFGRYFISHNMYTDWE